MKTLLLTVCIILSSNSFCFAQEQPINKSVSKTNFDIKEAEVALDKILDVTEKISIYKNNVNWKTLSPKVKNALDPNASNIFMAIKPSIGILLDELNDNHSFVMYNNKETAHRNHPKDITSTLSPEVLNSLKSTDLKLKSEIINENIGYILVPSNKIDIKEKESQEKIIGQEIRNALCQLSPERLKGIIVDLRLNTGGAMNPMIGGLGPIIGDGLAGYFLANGKTIDTWKIKNGNINQMPLENNCKPNKNIKIAILIGAATASSGEATAISFIGKSNVKLIGENSAGYTSGNSPIKISENLYYLLSTSYEADRNKKEYLNFVSPDIIIKDGDNFKDLSQDKKVQKAIEWINQ